MTHLKVTTEQMAGWASDLVWTRCGTEYYLLFFPDWNQIKTPLLSNPSTPTASARLPWSPRNLQLNSLKPKLHLPMH